MEVNFRFEIGQFLYLKQDLRRWHQTYDRAVAANKDRGFQSMGELAAEEKRPIGLQVLERQLQECYGGVQLHYRFRGNPNDFMFTEPELTADFNDPSVVAKKETTGVD